MSIEITIPTDVLTDFVNEMLEDYATDSDLESLQDEVNECDSTVSDFESRIDDLENVDCADADDVRELEHRIDEMESQVSELEGNAMDPYDYVEVHEHNSAISKLESRLEDVESELEEANAFAHSAYEMLMARTWRVRLQRFTATITARQQAAIAAFVALRGRISK